MALIPSSLVVRIPHIHFEETQTFKSWQLRSAKTKLGHKREVTNGKSLETS